MRMTVDYCIILKFVIKLYVISYMNTSLYPTDITLMGRHTSGRRPSSDPYTTKNKIINIHTLNNIS